MDKYLAGDAAYRLPWAQARLRAMPVSVAAVSVRFSSRFGSGRASVGHQSRMARASARVSWSEERWAAGRGGLSCFVGCLGCRCWC